MDQASTFKLVLGSTDHYTICYKYYLAQLRERVKADGLELVLDDQSIKPIQIFVAWAARCQEALNKLTDDKLSISKGLMLRGNVGSGKSVLFRTLRDIKLGNNYEMSQLFRGVIFDKCEKIAKLYQSGGDKAIEEFTKGVIKTTDNRFGKSYRNYCFDDLGNEEMKNHYGNQREVMKDVIDERYDQYVDDGLITSFTTNLTMDEIEKRYDRRTRSRLEHMCNIVGIGTSENYIDRRIR